MTSSSSLLSLVRTIDSVIDQLDLDPFLNKYEGGGASSCHPRMLLKVLVYGYLCNISSSRKLEDAVRENIHFMWLAGFTVNHRLSRLKAKARELLLSEEGIRKRKQRAIDVEPAFGQLKQNRNFKRFRFRGLPKVDVEIGLAAMAHNIAKMAG